jgi:predicted phosphodiesterase
LKKISFHKEYTNKYIIPDFVKDFSKRQFDIFLHTLIRGDGSYHKSCRSSMMFYGILEVLEQLQILCHSFGYKATLSVYREKHYRLNITEKASVTVNGCVGASDFSKTTYSGEVWCATVPNDTLVVRRNGKVSIQGNCRFKKYMLGSEAAKLGTALMSPTQGLKLKERGFNVIEDYPDGYVQLGNIQLIHGMYLNANHAKTHLQKVRSNIMYGHTHQLQVYSENGLTAYNIGNLADTDSPIFSYTNRFEKVNWKQGFAVITLDKGNTHVQVIEPVNNSFVYNGQIY